MSKKLFFLFITLGSFLMLFAQTVKIDFTEYELPNGLRVILHRDDSAPIVAVTVMYHVGSKNENPDRTGFAHFFEHLLFEGSENIKRGEFDKYVSNAGGELNANTSFDRTFYYEVLPSNQLELGLWLESERLLHAKVEREGIETQREVVKEERRQRYDNTPYGSVLEEILKRAYVKHPYRWSTIGSMEHLNAAKDEEFIQFYKTFYVPNNAILSIAGDIDIEATKKLIDKYFRDIPRGKAEIPRPNVTEPPQMKEVRDVVYDNIQLPAVVQAYHIPAQGTPEFYAVDMLFKILSEGESSRLYKSLVDEQEKALYVGTFPLSTEDPGLGLSFGIAQIGKTPKELEAAMEKEFDKVKKSLISEKEFQKLRNRIETEFVSNKATVRGRAEALANYRMYFGDAALINTEIDRYMQVTREDIRKAAQKYLRKENRVVLYYLPKSEQAASEKSSQN